MSLFWPLFMKFICIFQKYFIQVWFNKHLLSKAVIVLSCINSIRAARMYWDVGDWSPPILTMYYFNIFFRIDLEENAVPCCLESVQYLNFRLDSRYRTKKLKRFIQGLVFKGILKGPESKSWDFFEGPRKFRGPQKSEQFEFSKRTKTSVDHKFKSFAINWPQISI